MKYFKKLIGERIYLSPINLEDIEKYAEWMNDFKVTDGLGGSAGLITLEGEKEWLNNSLKSKDYNFAIVNIENDKLIGNCSLNEINYQNRIGTVGIFIGDEINRSKGYGAEVLRLLLDYGFNYLNITQ